MAGIDVVNKIIGPLNSAQDDIIALIDNLSEISQNATYAGGEISRVISSNLQKTIENLTNIANGTDQSSLSSLLTYMNNVPLGQIVPQSIKRNISAATNAVSGENAVSMPTPAAAPVNITPDTSSGPQSAIVTANESVQSQRLAHSNNIVNSYFNERVAQTGEDGLPQAFGESTSPNGLSFKRLVESGSVGEMSDDDLNYKGASKKSFTFDEISESGIIRDDLNIRTPFKGMPKITEANNDDFNEIVPVDNAQSKQRIVEAQVTTQQDANDDNKVRMNESLEEFTGGDWKNIFTSMNSDDLGFDLDKAMSMPQASGLHEVN